MLCIRCCCADMLENPDHNRRSCKPDDRQERYANQNPVELAHALEEFLHCVVTPFPMHSLIAFLNSGGQGSAPLPIPLFQALLMGKPISRLISAIQQVFTVRPVRYLTHRAICLYVGILQIPYTAQLLPLRPLRTVLPLHPQRSHLTIRPRRSLCVPLECQACPPLSAQDF